MRSMRGSVAKRCMKSGVSLASFCGVPAGGCSPLCVIVNKDATNGGSNRAEGHKGRETEMMWTSGGRHRTERQNAVKGSKTVAQCEEHAPQQSS